MPETDFFRQPLAQMIDPRHPLAVLASRLPWTQIEAALAPRFARQVRPGRAIAQDDLFGPSIQVAGGGIAAAGRPRLPVRLMVSLLYRKHASSSAMKNWCSAGPRTSCGSTSAA